MVNNLEQKPVDNGNTWLGLSAGTGTWGGMIYFVSGHFCPVCLVLTPLLFTGGLIKKFHFLKHKSKIQKNLLNAKAIGK